MDKTLANVPSDVNTYLSQLSDIIIQRFKNDKVFTQLDNVLLSVNPGRVIPYVAKEAVNDHLNSTSPVKALSSKNPSLSSQKDKEDSSSNSSAIPLYHASLMFQYFDHARKRYTTNGYTAPPHLFFTAATALVHAMADRFSQTIVIAGEVGSGKSESFKQVVRLLSTVSRSHRLRFQQYVSELELSGNFIPPSLPLLEGAVHGPYETPNKRSVVPVSAGGPVNSHSSFPSSNVASASMYSYASPSSTIPCVERLLSEVSTIFDAFGSAGEGVNNSPHSTRYFRDLKLEIAVDGTIRDASIDVFLLDPWRLVSPPAGAYSGSDCTAHINTPVSAATLYTSGAYSSGKQNVSDIFHRSDATRASNLSSGRSLSSLGAVPNAVDTNFRVFYQLLAGVSASERESLRLLPRAQDYRYLRNYGPRACPDFVIESEVAPTTGAASAYLGTSTSASAVLASIPPSSPPSLASPVLAGEFLNLRSAMTLFQLPSSAQTAIFRVLSAILLLGNLDFESTSVSSISSSSGSIHSVTHIKNGDVLWSLSSLLSIDVSVLSQLLTQHPSSGVAGSPSRSMSVAESQAARDALATTLYVRLWGHLNTHVKQILTESTEMAQLNTLEALRQFGFLLADQYAPSLGIDSESFVADLDGVALRRLRPTAPPVVLRVVEQPGLGFVKSNHYSSPVVGGLAAESPPKQDTRVSSLGLESASATLRYEAGVASFSHLLRHSLGELFERAFLDDTLFRKVSFLQEEGLLVGHPLLTQYGPNLKGSDGESTDSKEQIEKNEGPFKGELNLSDPTSLLEELAVLMGAISLRSPLLTTSSQDELGVLSGGAVTMPGALSSGANTAAELLRPGRMALDDAPPAHSLLAVGSDTARKEEEPTGLSALANALLVPWTQLANGGVSDSEVVRSVLENYSRLTALRRPTLGEAGNYLAHTNCAPRALQQLLRAASMGVARTQDPSSTILHSVAANNALKSSSEQLLLVRHSHGEVCYSLQGAALLNGAAGHCARFLPPDALLERTSPSVCQGCGAPNALLQGLQQHSSETLLRLLLSGTTEASLQASQGPGPEGYRFQPLAHVRTVNTPLFHSLADKFLRPASLSSNVSDGAGVESDSVVRVSDHDCRGQWCCALASVCESLESLRSSQVHWVRTLRLNDAGGFASRGNPTTLADVPNPDAIARQLRLIRAPELSIVAGLTPAALIMPARHFFERFVSLDRNILSKWGPFFPASLSNEPVSSQHNLQQYLNGEMVPREQTPVSGAAAPRVLSALTERRLAATRAHAPRAHDLAPSLTQHQREALQELLDSLHVRLHRQHVLRSLQSIELPRQGSPAWGTPRAIASSADVRDRVLVPRVNSLSAATPLESVSQVWLAFHARARSLRQQRPSTGAAAAAFYHNTHTLNALQQRHLAAPEPTSTRMLNSMYSSVGSPLHASSPRASALDRHIFDLDTFRASNNINNNNNEGVNSSPAAGLVPQFLVGDRNILLSQSFAAALEAARTQTAVGIRLAAARVRAVVRGHFERTRFLRLRSAVLALQAHVRGRYTRLAFLRLRARALLLKSSLRCFHARKRFLLLRSSAITIQRNWRRRRLAPALRRLSDGVRALHTLSRGFMRVAAVRRWSAAATRIQRCARRFLLMRRRARALTRIALFAQARVRGNRARMLHVNETLKIRRLQAFNRRRRYVRRFVATVRMLIVRQQYLLLRAAVVRLQRWWRATCLRHAFRRVVGAVLTFQRRVRTRAQHRRRIMAEFVDQRRWIAHNLAVERVAECIIPTHASTTTTSNGASGASTDTNKKHLRLIDLNPQIPLGDVFFGPPQGSADAGVKEDYLTESLRLDLWLRRRLSSVHSMGSNVTNFGGLLSDSDCVVSTSPVPKNPSLKQEGVLAGGKRPVIKISFENSPVAPSSKPSHNTSLAVISGITKELTDMNSALHSERARKVLLPSSQQSKSVNALRDVKDVEDLKEPDVFPPTWLTALSARRHYSGLDVPSGGLGRTIAGLVARLEEEAASISSRKNNTLKNGRFPELSKDTPLESPFASTSIPATPTSELDGPSASTVADSVVSVAVGEAHVVALTSSGDLYSWGVTSRGRLGLDLDFDLPEGESRGILREPRRLASLLSADHPHHPFYFSSLYDAPNPAALPQFSPVRLSPTRIRVVALAAGACHTLAVTATGALLAWGDNRRGQLGLASSAHSPEGSHLSYPVHVRAVPAGVVSVACGDFHSVVVAAQGQQLLAFGAGECAGAPLKVSHGDFETSLDCSSLSVDDFALLRGSSGPEEPSDEADYIHTHRLGSVSVSVNRLTLDAADAAKLKWNPRLLSRTDPHVLSGDPSAPVQPTRAAAVQTAAAIRSTPSSKKASESLLSAELDIPEDRFTPVLLAALPPESGERFVQAACGRAHSMALMSTGEVLSWGFNGYGQLGLGLSWAERHSAPLNPRAEPLPPSQLPAWVFRPTTVQLQSASVVRKVACGAYHSLLLDERGGLHACGLNSDGQLGLGARSQDFETVPLSLSLPAPALSRSTDLPVSSEHGSRVENHSYEVFVVDVAAAGAQSFAVLERRPRGSPAIIHFSNFSAAPPQGNEGNDTSDEELEHLLDAIHAHSSARGGRSRAGSKEQALRSRASVSSVESESSHTLGAPKAVVSRKPKSSVLVQEAPANDKKLKVQAFRHLTDAASRSEPAMVEKNKKKKTTDISPTEESGKLSTYFREIAQWGRCGVISEPKVRLESLNSVLYHVEETEKLLQAALLQEEKTKSIVLAPFSPVGGQKSDASSIKRRIDALKHSLNSYKAILQSHMLAPVSADSVSLNSPTIIPSFNTILQNKQYNPFSLHQENISVNSSGHISNTVSWIFNC